MGAAMLLVSLRTVSLIRHRLDKWDWWPIGVYYSFLLIKSVLLSTVLKPLNDLLKCDVYWFWGPEQEAAFAKVEDLISTALVFRPYQNHCCIKPMLVVMVSEVFIYTITVKSCGTMHSHCVLYPKAKRDTHKSRKSV